MSASNLHIAWARLFFRALAASGLRRVVLSPGSRSTPLALAAAADEALICFDVVDERSAAFFALGQARLTGEPTALVCTSGTAPAHYLPAVVEASQAFLPLLVVSADRPWEAYDAAAPQTIDQVKLFGPHVRHAAELGLPDPAPEALRAVGRIAAQAMLCARWPTPGPVHVNARFRKPLEPVEVAGPEPWEPEVAALLAAGPPRTYPPRVAPPPEGAVRELAAACARSRRGLIVCGPAPAHGDLEGARGAVADLARRAGALVLVDGTSQLRFGSLAAEPRVCPRFDVALRSASFRRAHVPDLVIELGGPPTSSGYATLLAEHPRLVRYVVAPHGFRDPHGTATALIHADPYETLRRVAAELGPRREPPDEAWASSFERAEARIAALVARELAATTLTEGAIAHDVVATLPEGSVLMVGNGMPVRDLDLYAPSSSSSLVVTHQRGANGIDGLVSGAVGAATVTRGKTVLLTGDVSLLHDLGALAAARALRSTLVVVVVHNDGGRIFEELPLARRPELAAALEAHFVVPHGVRFDGLAASFGLPHARVTERAELARALASALAREGCTLIEAVVPPTDAAARRARLRADFVRGEEPAP